MLFTLEGVSKSYGANLVLENITAKMENADRIGLIGDNGAGKSTLLGLIAGDLEPDTGTVARADKAFGFLRQNSGLSASGTLRGELREVFRPLLDMEAQMRVLETQLAHNPGCPELSARYAGLQTMFEQRGGYMVEVRINTVLGGMGFLGIDGDTPVSTLSGGEKTRLALCKLLLEEPELLILDEPTNHLDFKTLLWLEGYLASYKGALLVVSHDRYFLDKLCTSIWEVERQRLQVYPGNYSRYVAQKRERTQRLQKEYELQQQEIAGMKEFIARNMVRASTTARAQSRQKALERMELVEKPRPPAKPPKLRFTYQREPVKDVLSVRGLTLCVGEGTERKTLCEELDFTMLRGEKIALIGANGVGKSTFLKALMKLEQPVSGTVDWGGGVELSYFAQEEFGLHSKKTALDELWDRFPQEYEHTIRTVLGNMHITGENALKPVGGLSGGERQKLKLAILTLSCGNTLLMDEPTNHLDLAAKEALDTALRNYTGTLLVVSHDRYLLNKLPTKIAEMHPGGIRVYKGTYDQYVRQKEQEPAGGPAKSASEPQKPQNEYRRGKKQRSEEAAKKRRLRQCEERIEELEQEIRRLEEAIASPGISSDYAALQEACAQLEQARNGLDAAMEDWESICGELEC